MTTGQKEVLLLEPSSGISGDMFLASLLDLGLNRVWLKNSIQKVLPQGSRIDVKADISGGVSGTRFKVLDVEDEAHRSLKDIKSLIDKSSLPKTVRTRAIDMFELLAEVEAGIHGLEKSEVHFHEVGALDSIADIVGASAGIWKIDPARIHSTPINLGSGHVKTAHGELPVPAPATAEILRRCNAPTYSRDVGKELTTPTGALILASFVDEFSRPPMRLRSIGYGLGSHEIEGQGNFLRTSLGLTGTEKSGLIGEHEIVLETNIDDMNPELFPVVEEKLLEAGALDVFKTSVQMKKNRPGIKLTVICDRKKEKELSHIIFRETTTIGLRIHEVNRRKLDREIKTVKTEYGPVKIKVGYLNGDLINFSPEFESCQRLARENDIPVKDIYTDAISRAREKLKEA